jgi:uncharacterized protein (TIGR02145 family)
LIKLVSGNTTQNIVVKGLCTGDLDGSYIPPVTFLCGDTLVDQRDGQKYPTVRIGTQCWMKKNLGIGTYVTIYQTNNNILEKYCFNPAAGGCNTWGGFYTWDEMMQYDTTSRIKGICPEGFHIPDTTEFKILGAFLGGDSIAGGKMKEPGTTHWHTPNTGATYSSGFTAIGSGSWSGLQYDQSYYWTSSQYDASFSFIYILNNTSAQLVLSATVKGYGLSVRCLGN